MPHAQPGILIDIAQDNRAISHLGKLRSDGMDSGRRCEGIRVVFT